MASSSFKGALILLGLAVAAACSASSEAPSSAASAAGGAAASATAGGSAGAGGSVSGTGGEPVVVTTSGSSTSSGAAGAGGAPPPCAVGAGGGPSGVETCANGTDDDGNGFIDEGCGCQIGETQPCFPAQADLCDCMVGQQACVLYGEFGQWGPCAGAEKTCAGALDPSCELCGNGTDDDCDGAVDEDCVIDMPVDIDGDCVTASCPPQAPHPVGCNIVFSGGDERGCVANAAGSSVVFFKEGDKCGVGNVSGTLLCSSVAGPPLDEVNCPMNKPTKYYPADSSGCP